MWHKFPILPILNNSRQLTPTKTAHPLASPTDCDAPKPRPLPVMIGSRVILLPGRRGASSKSFWSKPASQMSHRLGGSLPPRTAPMTDLKRRRGSLQASSRWPRALRWILVEARTGSSKASLGQFQVLSNQRRNTELVGHKPHHGTSHGRSDDPRPFSYGRKGAKNLHLPRVICRSSNETLPRRDGDQPSLHKELPGGVALRHLAAYRVATSIEMAWAGRRIH